MTSKRRRANGLFGLEGGVGVVSNVVLAVRRIVTGEGSRVGGPARFSRDFRAGGGGAPHAFPAGEEECCLSWWLLVSREQPAAVVGTLRRSILLCPFTRR